MIVEVVVAVVVIPVIRGAISLLTRIGAAVTTAYKRDHETVTTTFFSLSTR